MNLEKLLFKEKLAYGIVIGGTAVVLWQAWKLRNAPVSANPPVIPPPGVGGELVAGAAQATTGAALDALLAL